MLGRRLSRHTAVRDRIACSLLPADNARAHGPADADRDRQPLSVQGEAEHWSVRVGDSILTDLVWSYPTPRPKSQKIAGLISFYTEKVGVYVDGVKQA